MEAALQELIDRIAPTQVDAYHFHAPAIDPGWGRLYGGEVLAQAAAAADLTVPQGRWLHSLHGYFLRPGKPGVLIDLEVDPIRDGRSFTTRRVVARQDGEAIFSLSASFQAPEEGLDHADSMPQVQGPDGLDPRAVFSRKLLDTVPDKLKERLQKPPAIEIRQVNPYDPTEPVVSEPRRQVWYRAVGTLPDDPVVHHRLLAWASDSHLLTTATQPHGVSWLTPGLQVASIDHALWIHRPFRMDEWLLYDVESSSLSSSRGWVRGRFFTQDGRLVATAVQEGLIRDRRT
ncbi:MAG: acyl-CoA thioesterase II [Rhodobacterales bacterium]|nr:acyl-CoA thioesterase II [Rhodobacterales bacterium]